MQSIIQSAQLDAVLSLEAADDMKAEVASLRAENSTLMDSLDLSAEKLNAALESCAAPGNSVTNWIDVLGKKGGRYSMYVKELGLQLMASEMSAAQAVYSLTIFMMKTHPSLTPGLDYRTPSESVFKEWGEGLYELVCEVNRSRLDEALIIYYKHDDSPRNGFSYHGANSEGIFVEDGERTKHHIPLVLEVLPNGEPKSCAVTPHVRRPPCVPCGIS